MKKFTKLFLSCAAVAAVTAAVATSAMAAGEITGGVTGVTGDVTVPETGAVTITNLSVGETPDANTQVTFLVFKGTADTDISADSVKGIDQGTAVQPTNNGLKSDVTVPESGQETYTVKVGYYKDGAFAVKSGTFKLGTPTGDDIIIGDVNDTEDVDSFDADAILWYGVSESKSANTGKTINLSAGGTLLVGDVNDTEDVDSFDADAILWYGVSESKSGRTGETVVGTIVDTQN